MADSQNSPKSDTPKRRSPVERAIVWGGILILVGLVLYEYQARTAHKNSFDKLTAALDAAENGTSRLTDADVPNFVSGFSKHEKHDPADANPLDAARMDKYTYSGLIPGGREIYVYYELQGVGDDSSSVLAVATERVKQDEGENPVAADEAVPPK